MFVFPPGQGQVENPQELPQGSVIHDVHHAHLCDEEVQDAAPGGH